MEDINLDCPTRGIGVGICGDVVSICESNGFVECVRAHYFFHDVDSVDVGGSAGVGDSVTGTFSPFFLFFFITRFSLLSSST